MAKRDASAEWLPTQVSEILFPLFALSLGVPCRTRATGHRPPGVSVTVCVHVVVPTPLSCFPPQTPNPSGQEIPRLPRAAGESWRVHNAGVVYCAYRTCRMEIWWRDCGERPTVHLDCHIRCQIAEACLLWREQYVQLCSAGDFLVPVGKG